jgi:hypothetical protein
MPDPRSTTYTRQRPYYKRTTAQQLRGRLQWKDQGHGVKFAEEDGRTYQIEFTGIKGNGGRDLYHASATEKKTRRTIASKRFSRASLAIDWCETIRRPFAGTPAEA